MCVIDKHISQICQSTNDMISLDITYETEDAYKNIIELSNSYSIRTNSKLALNKNDCVESVIDYRKLNQK
jgi:hypothetical protein